MSQQKTRTALEAWYSDEIWGKQICTDNTLFEIMSLQVFQAGLGWKLILSKRDGFRKAFRNWNIPVVAQFGQDDIDRLTTDPSIIRNKVKIKACVFNARHLIEIQKIHGSFVHWFYDVLEGNLYPPLQKELRSHFKFMGPELCRMWLMASGRITMAEGDSYRPPGTPAYLGRPLWGDSPELRDLAT